MTAPRDVNTRIGHIELGAPSLKHQKEQALEYVGAALVQNLRPPRGQISPLVGRDRVALIPYSTGRGPRLYDLTAGYLGGELRINAGFANDKVVKILDGNMAQLVPWAIPLEGNITVHRRDRHIEILIPWPDKWIVDDLSFEKLMGDSGTSAALNAAWQDNRLVLGVDSQGELITPQFVTTKRGNALGAFHLGIIGVTGYGKSWLAMSLRWQLAMGYQRAVAKHQHQAGLGRGRFIPSYTLLIDGKGDGDGLPFTDGMPGQTGPAAYTVEDTQRALYWVYREKEQRKERMRANKIRACPDPPIYIFVSDFSTLTEDELVAWFFEHLARQGRAQNIHLVMENQDFFADAFGSAATPRQIDMRITFKLNDEYDNRAALPKGCSLQAHMLLSRVGEAILATEGWAKHILVPYATESQMRELLGHEPLLDAWPEVEIEKVMGFSGEALQRDDNFTPEEWAAAIYGEAAGLGRGKIQETMRELGATSTPGSGRMDRLRGHARQINERLKRLGYCSL